MTGGSSGIGRATALEFAAEGASVVIAARSAERGREAQRVIEEAGGVALFTQADVSVASDVERLVRTTVDTYGRLDYAVNNAAAGDLMLAPAADLSEQEVDRVLAVNLKGVWLCMQQEIRQMLTQGSGAIVNVSSVNGLSGTPMASHYAASKHGVLGLTKSAALEYARAGIRINAVCPGAFRTPMLEGVFDRASGGHPEEVEKQYVAAIPLGRIGAPEEVARAIVWLCSAAASYVTGHVMTVDGGLAAGLAR